MDFLRCLGEEEAKQALEEAHSGICDAHQSGPKLHYRIKRIGYYWPTMVQDSMECAKKYEACQYHAKPHPPAAGTSTPKCSFLAF